MSRPVLEVADIFRGHGPAWRQANAGHVGLGQLKVLSAIENCRTAALGKHAYEGGQPSVSGPDQAGPKVLSLNALNSGDVTPARTC